MDSTETTRTPSMEVTPGSHEHHNGPCPCACNCQVWAGPLWGGRLVVGFVNKDAKAARNVSASWTTLRLALASQVQHQKYMGGELSADWLGGLDRASRSGPFLSLL